MTRTPAENAVATAFPSLRTSIFSIESPRTGRYNCIAYAAGDDAQWWWPLPDPPEPGQHWPDGVPRTVEIRSFRLAFESIGYERCDSPDLEEGYEKVAIYVDADGKPTHAARQLPSGKWCSKLGKAWDIEHEVPVGVCGTTYGSIGLYLRRATS